MISTAVSSQVYHLRKALAHNALRGGYLLSDYDLARLSNSGFERLSCDVLNAELGLRLETYPEGRDGGIDLREVRPDGYTIVGQCKNYARSDTRTFLRAVRKEWPKPGRQQSDRYLFTTTHPMSPQVQTEVAKILNITESEVWGPSRINDALRLPRNSDIVQSHHALWLSSTATLERILKADLWNHTEYLLEQCAEQSRYWVETPAHSEARELLEREGVCIISGLPGSGKSFLAERLALDALSRDWQVFATSKPDEAWSARRLGSKQMFYFDDFLGEMSLRTAAKDQAAMLLNLINFVYSNRTEKRLVMTTRAHVLTEAKSSDRLAKVADRRRMLHLEPFDAATRREILVAHLSLSALSDEERERALGDRRLLSLAENPAFNLRLVATVGENIGADDTAGTVLERLLSAFAVPKELWENSFWALSPDAMEALLTLATFPPRPVERGTLRKASGFEGGTPDWHVVLRGLEPTWIDVVDADPDKAVVFSNPSCRDFLLAMLDDHDHAVDGVARVASIDQLSNLAQQSGLIPAALSARVHRPKLARVLLNSRDELTSKIIQWTDSAVQESVSTASTLACLAVAAPLLATFGRPECGDWLLARVQVEFQSAGLPPSPALSLARNMVAVPVTSEDARAATIEQLIQAALTTANTSTDLLPYEALPNKLITEATESSAREQALRIFTAELETLIASGASLDVALEEGEDLRDRALRYGFELDLADLWDSRR
ncbi:restriction endonuclease [Nocardia sp. NPDC048505]|uniref:nSTAND3 domain-containing NTPase n=1 Tax=unclassified Nocardia TaxID=2637762 RepID=UPI0034057CD0